MDYASVTRLPREAFRAAGLVSEVEPCDVYLIRKRLKLVSEQDSRGAVAGVAGVFLCAPNPLAICLGGDNPLRGTKYVARGTKMPVFLGSHCKNTRLRAP